MSYPYPQNRRREQREKGEQPYKDAREEMGEAEAEIQEQASRKPDTGEDLPEEERTELQEDAAEDRFEEIGEEQRKSSKSS